MGCSLSLIFEWHTWQSERDAVTVGSESDQKTFGDGGWNKMYQSMLAASFLNALNPESIAVNIASTSATVKASFLQMLTLKEQSSSNTPLTIV